MKYCHFFFLVHLLIVSSQNSSSTIDSNTTISPSPSPPTILPSPSPPSILFSPPISPPLNNTNTTTIEGSDVFPVAWIWGASGALLFVLLLYTAPRILSVSVEEVSDEK